MMRYLARRVGRVPQTTPDALRVRAFRLRAFRTAGPVLLLSMALVLAGCQSSPHEPESSDTGTATGADANAGASQVAQAPHRPTSSARSLPTPKPTPSLPGFATGTVPVQVLMKEYAYLPNPLTLKSGQRTTLALINRGKMAHEFQIGRDAAPDKSGFKEDLFAGVEVKTGTSADEAADGGEQAAPVSDPSTPVRATVPPGATIYMTFTLPRDRRGEWEMGCFEKQHYGAGMHGKVRVE